MKHFDPAQNLFSASFGTEIPKLSIQTERVHCFNCGQVTCIPVRLEYVDWQSVAEEYRKQLSRLMDEHLAIMAEMELIYGVDNPAAVHYRNKWAMLVLEIRQHFGGSTNGTSAHMGESDWG
jgi:hypothetical protein